MNQNSKPENQLEKENNSDRDDKIDSKILLKNSEDDSINNIYIPNPINEIVKYYNAITPLTNVESFITSTEKLLQDLDSNKVLYEDNDLLCKKWESGIAVLKELIVNHSSPSTLDKLFSKVSDVIDNGFYDVSNTIIAIDPSKKDLEPLFKKFWKHLLQARDITEWCECTSSPEITIRELSCICYELGELVNNNKKVDNIFWSISILGDLSMAIGELSESGEPSETEILEAKRNALKILKNMLKDIPTLRSSLGHFIMNE